MFPMASLRRWALLTVCVLGAAPALAQDPTSGVFDLGLDLYSGDEGAFGTVVVTEDGDGGLHFQLSLDPNVVGERATMRRLFLAMGDMREALRAIPDDRDAVKMLAHRQHYSWHTLGAEFGVIPNIRAASIEMKPRYEHRKHERRWRKHRRFWRPEALQDVGFTLVAREPLALADVLGMTATWQGEGMQIGLQVRHAKLGRHHRSPAMLAGLFEADAPPAPAPTPPGGGGSSGGGSGGPTTTPGTVVPPGCFGELDPVTGQVVNVICP